MKINFQKIKEAINKKTFWILFGIILIGIFLRTYNFHDWMHFGKDQARDAFIVESVIKGDLPIPFLGPKMGNSGYKLGPLFYYVKIASGKIFGVGPDKLTYPELFFSILTIPLFYLFLKRYFTSNLSLALTGLFSISFFAIRYSRFAWNLNLIPFFVLLFLLSLSEFLREREKTKWIWIIALGISLGVNVQLHAILIFLSGILIPLAFGYAIWKNKKTWKKCAAIFLIAIIFNAGQIIGESKTNYLNTKNFIGALTDKSDNSQSRIIQDLELGLACYSQSNVQILTSLGEKDNCNLINKNLYKKNRIPKTLEAIASFSFILFGFCLLCRYFKRETDKKKKFFLGLLIFYSFLFFLIMLPVMKGATIRYYIHIFFLPYFFLGLTIQFLAEKFPKKYLWISAVIVAALAASNLFSVKNEAQQLLNKSRSRADTVILGEVEPLADFVIKQSLPEKEVFITGRYASSYTWPLRYLVGKSGITLTQLGGKEKIPAGKPFFDINPIKKKMPKKGEKGYKGENFLNSGNISLYKLDN